MALINAVKSDPKFKKASIQTKFDMLKEAEKKQVLNYLDNPTEKSLGGESKNLVEHPHFKEIFTARKVEEEEEHASKLIRTLSKIAKGLNPEYAERVGGSQRMGSPFDGKFESAYQSEGVRGLARLHKNMINDVEYQQYLDGV